MRVAVSDIPQRIDLRACAWETHLRERVGATLDVGQDLHLWIEQTCDYHETHNTLEKTCVRLR